MPTDPGEPRDPPPPTPGPPDPPTADPIPELPTLQQVQLYLLNLRAQLPDPSTLRTAVEQTMQIVADNPLLPPTTH